jgi:hypothetical protein
MALLLTAVLVFASACSGPAHERRTRSVTSAAPITTRATTTVTSPPCETLGSPHVQPAAAALLPLLLVPQDLPAGYTTTGPVTEEPAGPEFFGVVPSTVPIAYVVFAMNSNPTGIGGTDLTQDGVIEALAKTSSPTQAVALLQAIDQEVTACDAGGSTVTLPGTHPPMTVMASVGGTSAQSIASAASFSTKGSYVLSVRWFNTNLVDPSSASPPTAAPPLPTVAVIASVVNAARNRIPN